MARESIVGEKSLAFGKRIAKCYRYLKDKKKETVMSKQLLRCGTSIGANIREGLYAQSRKDFISKLNIALKEAGETDYWLDVIHSAEYFTDDEYKSLRDDSDELLKLLTSIIKTTKDNSWKDEVLKAIWEFCSYLFVLQRCKDYNQ